MRFGLVKAVAGFTLVAALALPLATTAQAHRNLYVSSGNGAGVTAFDISPSSGALVPVAGSPFDVGIPKFGTVVSPDGRHLFAADTNGGVSVYDIDQSNGALVKVAGSPFAAGPNPVAVAVNPAGTHLFVTDNNYAIFVLDINQSTGALENPRVTASASAPFGVAVDRAGTHLFVAGDSPDEVSVYNINQSTGDLTAVAGSPFAGGSAPLGVGINPAGTRLFVANRGDGSVSVYDIDQSNGVLTEVAGSPFTAGAGPGAATQEVAVNPAGTRLFGTNSSDGSVSAFDISQSNGALTAVAGSPFGAGTYPEGIEIGAAGTNLFVANFGSGNVSAYGIDQSNGALAHVAGSPFSTGDAPDFFATALTPDQPPTATFTAVGRPAGQVSTFNAAGSTDADGTVARYDWDFGDGTSLANGGPTPSHTYAINDPHTARLTVTDNEGCSTALVWQGQSAYCNGSAVATTTRTLLTIADLAIKQGHFKVNKGGAAMARIKKGAKISFRLNTDATVTFTLVKRHTGRKVGGRCVKPRRGNRAKRRCAIDYVPAGDFSSAGRAGSNSIAFSGKLKSGSLEPGVYKLTANATKGSDRSNTETRKFKVTCPDRAKVCFGR